MNPTDISVRCCAHLPTRCRFIAMMPQWDFLNFVAEHARRYPEFRLKMEADVTDLLFEGAQITGLRATTAEGELTVRADLVVGGRIFVMLNREDYWQCAFVIPKGGMDEIHRHCLASFRQEITRLAPYLEERTAELTDWSDVKLLNVAVDRLRIWHRPVHCVSAMPPTPYRRSGGLGINLAIQDAVAAANILAQRFRQRDISKSDLRAAQHRREFPTRATQAMQVFIQNRVVGRVLGGTEKLSPPLFLRILAQTPLLN